MKLHVKVKPGSKSDAIIREADGTVKIRIKARPVAGKANDYLVKFLANRLGLAPSKVTLQKGETSSFKTITIEADESGVWERLFQ